MALLVNAVRYLASNEGRSMAGVWIRVDGGAYLKIASDGYSYAPSQAHPLVAWFPGYPLLVRALGSLLADPLAAAILISLACGLAVAVLFWRWTGSRLDQRQRNVALAVLLLYAYGWYLYGTVYSDAMFVALALGAFVLADQQRIWLAAVVSGAASGTRPVGVAVAVALTILVLERDAVLAGGALDGWAARWHLPGRFDARRLRPRHLGVLLVSLWGVIAYSIFLAMRWQQPLLWVGVQEHWSQGPTAGPQSWFKIHMAARMIRIHELDYIVSNLVQLALILGVLACVPSVIRRFGLAYGAYVAVIASIVLVGTNELIGAGRYALGAFPVAAVVGCWLEARPALARWCLAGSGLALLALTALFARGAYLT